MSLKTSIKETVSAINTEERTWRATLETPKGSPYTLTIHRETRVLDTYGNEIGGATRSGDYTVVFDDISTETVDFTINGSPVTATVAELGTALQTYFDQKTAALKELTPAVPVILNTSPPVIAQPV